MGTLGDCELFLWVGLHHDCQPLELQNQLLLTRNTIHVQQIEGPFSRISAFFASKVCGSLLIGFVNSFTFQFKEVDFEILSLLTTRTYQIGEFLL